MDFALSREQRAIRDSATAVGRALIGKNWEDMEERSEYLHLLAESGMTGIALPVEDGGQGFSLLDSVIALEAITIANPHAGDAVQATNFGAIRQIAASGSQALKESYLAPALAGKALCSVAISEAEAGSAVSEMRTTARIEGDSVVINGSKIFNTNGPFATHYVVWARFGPGGDGIGSIVVPADTPGFSRGKTERYLSGEPHCALFFDNCAVPQENVLTEKGGLRRLLPVFNIERLGNASRSLACGQKAFDLAVEHAKNRRQFDRPLAEFQGLQWKFADMRVKLEGARLLLYRAASAAGGVPDSVEGSIAKLACNLAGFEVTNEAVQIFGGLGLSTEYPLGYLMARTRAWMIAGGTTEMLRTRIAEGVFGQSFRQRPVRVS